MKDILVINTGGTIGSSLRNNIIAPDKGAFESLIREYEDETGDFDRFDYLSPFTILSENADCGTWYEILKVLKSIKSDEYRGIIITHGTDTLSFTGAFLSAVCEGYVACPIVLVSADKPHEVMGSNAFYNFLGAVTLIDFLKKAAMPEFSSDIYVTWFNSKGFFAYRAGELLGADSASDDFTAFGGEAVFEFYPEGLSLTGSGYSFRPVRNDKHTNHCKNILTEDEKRHLWSDDLDFSVNVLFLFQYPGLDFNNLSTNGFDAVLVYSYHSGTFCMTKKSDRRSFSEFVKRMNKEGKRVYAGSFKESVSGIYETARDLEGLELVKLYDMSPESAYVTAAIKEILYKNIMI